MTSENLVASVGLWSAYYEVVLVFDVAFQLDIGVWCDTERGGENVPELDF